MGVQIQRSDRDNTAGAFSWYGRLSGFLRFLHKYAIFPITHIDGQDKMLFRMSPSVIAAIPCDFHKSIKKKNVLDWQK